MDRYTYKARYRALTVHSIPHLNGGGSGFGQEFVRVVKEKIGRVDHLFEYCAGPGFIGFSLLAHGLCKRVTLADVNPESIRACEVTIQRNRLQGKVAVYLSDCLDDIPETEKWDLVVSNPPHWAGSREDDRKDMRYYDPDWIVHKKFYQDIHKFLKPNGSILFQENGRSTKAEDFIPMIQQNHLKVVDIFKAKPLSLFQCLVMRKNIYQSIRDVPRLTRPSEYYFIWSRRDSTVVEPLAEEKSSGLKIFDQELYDRILKLAEEK